MKPNPNKIGISVKCTTCGMRKKPIGRSAPQEIANSLCDWDCLGYHNEPIPGSLWPNETEAEFGYLVGNEGVIIKSNKSI